MQNPCNALRNGSLCSHGGTGDLHSHLALLNDRSAVPQIWQNSLKLHWNLLKMITAYDIHLRSSNIHFIINLSQSLPLNQWRATSDPPNLFLWPARVAEHNLPSPIGKNGSSFSLKTSHTNLNPEIFMDSRILNGNTTCWKLKAERMKKLQSGMPHHHSTLFIYQYVIIKIRESSLLLKTGQLSRYSDSLRAGRSGIESRWGRDFPPVQTGPGAHPAFCKMGTGSFPGVKCGRGVLMTTHPLLVPRSCRVEL